MARTLLWRDEAKARLTFILLLAFEDMSQCLHFGEQVTLNLWFSNVFMIERHEAAFALNA